MELTLGWCEWYITEKYITSALRQLDERGVDRSTVHVMQSFTKGGLFLIVYLNEEKVEK